MADTPNFKVWDLVDPLRLNDAAHLWVNRVPTCDPVIYDEALANYNKRK